MPNGICINKFNPSNEKNILRKELQITQDEKIIGTVCRLSSEKGMESFVAAANNVLTTREDVTFVIVGDGPMRDKLQKMALASSKPQKIIFTGYRSDVPRILPCFDIFLLAFLSESFGIVILEAMASGVPVIATRSGGPAEIIEDGIDGFLVNPRDSEQLSEKVLFLLDRPDVRKEVKNRALKKVSEKYDIVNIVKQLEDAYAEVSIQDN